MFQLKVLSKRSATPADRQERNQALDILRGVAILGILLSNMQVFSGPGSILLDIPVDVARSANPAPSDVGLMIFEWLFVEGKMRAMLGLMFGAGTVLLLDRLSHEVGVGRAADVFHRRSMWLMGFGLLHGIFIFSGDVLFFYGTVALLCLFPLRNLRSRTLIAAGLAVAIVGGSIGVGNAFSVKEATSSARVLAKGYADLREHRPLNQAEDRAIAEARHAARDDVAALPARTLAGRGGFVAGLVDNRGAYRAFLEEILESGWILEVVGVMIAGMGLSRTGFLFAGWPSRLYVVVAIAGYAVSAPIVLTGIWNASLTEFSLPSAVLWMYGSYCLQQTPAMLADVAIVMLVVRSGLLPSLQRGLAATGRMALTNYIAQSLICRFIFSWGPWPLYGGLRFHEQLYVVAAIWIVQISLSCLWLGAFRSGPLEWLWRSLTYAAPQPFRRAAARDDLGGGEPGRAHLQA